MKEIIPEGMLKSMETKNTEQYIKELSARNSEPEWLLDRRLKAFNIFKANQMPNFIYGLNISMNIGLNLDDVDAAETKSVNLTIKNSNKNVVVEDFSGMLKNHEKVLEEKFMSIVPAREKFTSFHSAFLNNLVFVYIPKNTAAKEPIELASIIESGAVFDHLIVLAEDNTELTLIEDSSSNDGNINSYRSKIVEIFIGNNAKINYGNVQLLNPSAFNFTVKKASVGKNSTLNWMDCCFGSKVTLSDVTTLLDGEGAMTNNHGIFFGSKDQQFDLVAKSIHNAPHTISDILTKGALTDSAKCLYRGLVRIESNAFGSNGYQKEDTLLLSSDAAADSIPNLEIENNDVRCTHGASIGRIDREKLFYMMSRGLNNEQATREYVKGFFEPLIQKIQIKHLRENMHEMIEGRMR